MNRMNGVLGTAMLHEELTGKILEACFEVINELGAGFLEGVYEEALLIALRQKGIEARSQVPLKVRFRGAIVGDFCADILVEGKVIIELKAAKALAPEHQAQLINLLESDGHRSGSPCQFRPSQA